jgi:hypothetical protein
MKTKNYCLILMTALMLSVGFTSCGKQGDPGPQGEKGDTGAAGADGTNGTNGAKGTAGDPGATGDTGAKGATGTANVIYSDWITPPSYTMTTVFGLKHFDADITAAKITQAVLDNGVVLVFGKLNGYNPVIWPTDQVSEMPISVNYIEGTTTYEDVLSANVVLGKITIDFVDNQNLYSGISNAHQFRYVIIPGGVHAAGNINIHNYAQVKAAFHLKD